MYVCTYSMHVYVCMRMNFCLLPYVMNVYICKLIHRNTCKCNCTNMCTGTHIKYLPAVSHGASDGYEVAMYFFPC